MTRTDDELSKLNAEEVELKRKKQRADRAADILDDDLFKGAVQAARDKLVQRLTRGDAEKLKEARMAYDALELVVSALHEHMQYGHIVKAKLDDIAKRRTFLSRWRAA